MSASIPKIFAAVYVDDQTIGGLVESLRRAEIDSLVIPSAHWPRDWVPEWVKEPHRVKYYVLVKWNYEARFIAHRDFPLNEWIAEGKIELLPRRWLAIFRSAD